MILKKHFPIAVLAIAVFIAMNADLNGQNISKLPRSNPETEGVSSNGILDFLNAADTSDVELHSFMFIRHGKVIAEGWWEPYGPEYKHLLYSASKTFTATAVGLAVNENRLKVTDRVVSFFPYSLPDSMSTYMKDSEKPLNHVGRPGSGAKILWKQRRLDHHLSGDGSGSSTRNSIQV